MVEGSTILLVEDSAIMRRLVREMLRSFGTFRVIEARDGSEALAALAEESVDLVLSDWNMLPLDGLHLLQTMRGTLRGARTPFIMMTGEQSPETISQAVAAGVSGYLTKPFSRQQLARMVTRALAGTQHSGRAA